MQIRLHDFCKFYGLLLSVKLLLYLLEELLCVLFSEMGSNPLIMQVIWRKNAMNKKITYQWQPQRNIMRANFVTRIRRQCPIRESRQQNLHTWIDDFTVAP